MKHYLFLALLSIMTVFSVNAQTSQTDNKSCHFGITFEISDNPSWGYGEPVVLTVEPNSPADKAGIKPDDIIMEINSTATYLRSYGTIFSWLFDNSQEEVSFTIRNLNTYFKEYKLTRLCKSVNAMSEFDLASAFSMYSLEDTRDISFEIPLKVTPNKDVDYADYQTFDFVAQKNAPMIDRDIQKYVEADLTARGLVRNTKNPDCVIQTYYSYEPNPRYDESNSALADANKQLRFDVERQTLVRLPILASNDAHPETKAAYIVQYGIRIFDKKNINPKELTQIWDCNIKEYLTKHLPLDEYARVYTPLFLMQYPYSKDKVSAKYLVSYRKYNYTGLNFDSKNIAHITDVDPGSPANYAALKAGDEILAINKNLFSYTHDEMNDGYKRFIGETMRYRNPETRFTDAKGFPDCMYWSKKDYEEVAKKIKKSIYTPSFAYLYDFNRYISGKKEPEKTILVEIKAPRARYKKKEVKVTPEIRTSLIIRAL